MLRLGCGFGEVRYSQKEMIIELNPEETVRGRQTIGKEQKYSDYNQKLPQRP